MKGEIRKLKGGLITLYVTLDGEPGRDVEFRVLCDDKILFSRTILVSSSGEIDLDIGLARHMLEPPCTLFVVGTEVDGSRRLLGETYVSSNVEHSRIFSRIRMLKLRVRRGKLEIQFRSDADLPEPIVLGITGPSHSDTINAYRIEGVGGRADVWSAIFELPAYFLSSDTKDLELSNRELDFVHLFSVGVAVGDGGSTRAPAAVGDNEFDIARLSTDLTQNIASALIKAESRLERIVSMAIQGMRNEMLTSANKIERSPSGLERKGRSQVVQQMFDDTLVGVGWFLPEWHDLINVSFCWMGKNADIILEAPPYTALEVVIKGVNFIKQDFLDSLSIKIDQRVVALDVTVAENRKWEARGRIEREYAFEKLVTMRFSTTDAVRPSENEPRKLSIAFSSIRLGPILDKCDECT